MENAVIKEVVLSSNAENIAVCSWLLTSKLRQYIGRPREITISLLEEPYEVLAFTQNTKHHRMLESACAWHPNFLEILDKILKKIGISRPGEIKRPIYQNAFAARRDIYQDYVINYLSPAMSVMESDPEIYSDITKDAKYASLNRTDYSFLQPKIGFPYMPYAPFILERLFSIYVQNKKIKVTPL